MKSYNYFFQKATTIFQTESTHVVHTVKTNGLRVHTNYAQSLIYT